MKGLGKSNRKGDTKGWCLNNLYGENQHKVFSRIPKIILKSISKNFLAHVKYQYCGALEYAANFYWAQV